MVKLCYACFLNLLWMVCSLPIITVGASTTALYYACLKIVREEDFSAASLFFRSFKQNFKQATVLWLILLAAAVILAGDGYILWHLRTHSTGAPAVIWTLLLADVAERGMTVLVSSHNLRELEDVCDHVGIMDKGRMLLERPLAALQENTVKIQLALPDGAELPEGLDILHETRTGRLRQLILRGNGDELTARLSACNPFFLDALPLSLEEIFIYELGGEDHAIKNILL